MNAGAARSVASIRRDVADWFAAEYPGVRAFRRSPHRLLAAGESSAKLRKSARRTWGLAMLPSRVWVDPVTGSVSLVKRDGWQYMGNVCPHADGCESTCIATTGHYGMGQASARVWTRVLWHRHRSLFLELLRAELDAVEDWARRESRRRHRRVTAAVRLNVIQDVDWPRWLDLGAWPHLSFYDYTKDWSRRWNDRYHLTYSVTRSTTLDQIRSAVRRGVNVAVVVRTAEDATASTFAGLPAVNGDETDDRTTDPRGVVVQLRVKRPTNGAPVSAIYAGGMVRDARGRVVTDA